MVVRYGREKQNKIYHFKVLL